MQFTNEFTAPAPADEVYAAMLDVRGVATCMPGATIGEENEDGSLAATVAVKVGPIRMTYGGTVKVEEADQASRTARLRVVAREQRGQGGAEANVTLTVADQNGGSHATMVTDLSVTGRVAQMGAGVMQEVANSMVGQFADCLSSRLAPAPTPVTPSEPGEADEATAPPPPEPPGPPPPKARTEQQELKALPLLFKALAARIRRIFSRS
ncbi:MAG: SRPBCC family protein [Gaiellales bacterium]